MKFINTCLLLAMIILAICFTVRTENRLDELNAALAKDGGHSDRAWRLFQRHQEYDRVEKFQLEAAILDLQTRLGKLEK